MEWRLATSLRTLLDEVNALYPGRSKVTDGTISGHPGSISSHNVNSAGVVCAVDITTGHGQGITTAQGQALADRLRVACRDQPRGIPCYVIHWMAPPYVAIEGAKIASAPDYEWRPYTGPAPHKDHLHLSADMDIRQGWPPSGLADYDLQTPWLTLATYTETSMAMAEAKEVVEALLNHQITLPGDKKSARFLDHFVNLCQDAKGAVKLNTVLTSFDGKTTARVQDILANVGNDARRAANK